MAVQILGRPGDNTILILVIFTFFYFSTIPPLLWTGRRIYRHVQEKKFVKSFLYGVVFMVFYLLPYVLLLFFPYHITRTQRAFLLVVLIFVITLLALFMKKGKKNIFFRPLSFTTSEIYVLSNWFHSFYKRKPWKEEKVCPKCKLDDDFGPEYIFLYRIQECPKCNTRLEPFWSYRRTENYIRNIRAKKNFWSIGAYLHDRELIGWVWGYETHELLISKIGRSDIFFLDIIGIQPKYRISSWLGNTKKIVFAILSRIIKVNLVMDALMRNLNPPTITWLFYFVLKHAKKHHYQLIATRTHKHAYNVQASLRYVGFNRLFQDVEDLEREFWLRKY